MLDYFNKTIKPLNDELGESLGIKKVQIKYVPQYVRFEFLTLAESKIAEISKRIHGDNAGYYRNQVRVYSTIKQPLKMIERV